MERMKRPILMLAVVVLVGGCATMLPGKIISLSDGTTLPMQIQTSYGSGKMTAYNPKTGENFEGTYTGVFNTTYSQASVWSGGQTTTGTLRETSNSVPASAVLVGDKGTVLNIRMLIQAGWRPIGFGEAEDNKRSESSGSRSTL